MMSSKGVPKLSKRAAIQKRRAAQRKPAPQARPDIQQYMRSWEVEEDEALLAALEQYGAKWRQVAAMVPGRSEAMCRNRYQRIMAPVKEGTNCTSRNKCTRCGQMKRGHTCRALTLVDVPSMPSPLVFDSLGLNGDIERLEPPPEPSVSPLPLGCRHPGRMTMAVAAGAIAPTEDIVMDLLLPEELDELEEATEAAGSSAATSECGDERPASVVLVTEPSCSDGDAAAPTPVKTVFKFQLAESVRPAARVAEVAACAIDERLADEEVAAALSIDGTGCRAALAPPLDLPGPQSPTVAPPVVSAPPLMVGGSFIAGLLGGSFDASTMPPAPAPCKQASHTLFLLDLEAQARRAGGSPPPALPALDDHSPPSFNRVISLSTLGALGF